MMWRKEILGVALGFCAGAGFSRDSDFEAFLKHEQSAYEQYASENQEQYDAFVAEFEREFAAFESGVSRKWGEVKIPSAECFVDYSPDTTAVSEVDCERGIVTVEVIQEDGETEEQAKERLRKEIKRIVTHRGTNRLVPIGREGEEPVLEKPIIGDQVVDEKGKTVGAENVDAFAKKVVEQAKSIAPVPTKTDSLKAPKKLTLTIPLAPDHLRRRAEAFLPAVEKYSRMYSVDPAYILATIHTESHFNPMARSHCNAMGLMQLMAKSGGREACREVYGKDVIPPPATLFNPEKNIMLGTAYISILLKRYYGEVANDSSRIYCAVSAYNTGAGNVAKALVGVPKLKRSRDRINTLPHDEVLRILLSELPYVETRAYLRKVLDRMPLYR